jgi:transposase InsO family protein
MDARKELEDWRKYYNEDRPHRAINKPAVYLMTLAGASSPPERQRPETLPSGGPTMGSRSITP